MYISDHHAIFCLVNDVKSQQYKHNSIMKRSFCERNVSQFIHYRKKETWDIAYEKSTQLSFSWFQCVFDLFFDKCFKKRYFKVKLSVDDQWYTNSNHNKE